MKGRVLARCLAYLLLAGLALSVFSAVPLGAQDPDELEPGWREPVSLSQNFPQSYLPDIAADQAGNLYVVWDASFEPRDSGWGDGIGFAMWDGTSWSEGVDIFYKDISHLPAVDVDTHGRIHLIGDGYTTGRAELWYSWAWALERPVDHRAWSDPICLSDGFTVYWNDIVIDSQDWIHVMFSGYDPSLPVEYRDDQCFGGGCDALFYTRSTDGGDTWSQPVRTIPGLGNGGRFQLIADGEEVLHVVWDTEAFSHGGKFISSANGYMYSRDRGITWSEPELQLLDTRGVGNEPSHVYWLNVAADSQQTIHMVAVAGAQRLGSAYEREQDSGIHFRHFRKEGLDNTWVEEIIPSVQLAGLDQNYSLRAITIDSSDKLHLIVPTRQSGDSEVQSGLFHAVWSREDGWSEWRRVTHSTLGRGSGLGSLAMSEGNLLNVVWFEHMGNSSGFLFDEPRGMIEVYYAGLRTEANPIPLIPLPQFPVSGVQAMSTKAAATAQVMPSSLPYPRTVSDNVPKFESAQPPSRAANGMVFGVGVTVLVLAVAAGAVARRARQ